MEFLVNLVAVSLACVGWKVVTTEGFVLGFLSKLAKKLPVCLAKPLVTCVVCYASIWGTLGYLSTFHTYTVQSWLVFVLGLAYLNYLFYALLQWVDKSGEHQDGQVKIIRHTYKNINFD